MKRWHYGLLLIILVVISLRFPQFVIAGGKAEHDRILREVLLGTKSSFSNPDALGSLQLLQDASQMAIDSNQSQTTLDKLRKEVKGLPKSVSEFNGEGTGGRTHRNYTHKGWDYDYGNDDKAHWKDIRKDILRKTVNEVFDFGLLSGKAFFGFDEKCDSMSALIYYIHILCDHKSNEVFQKDYKEIPLIKGTTDKYGIIEELEKHCEVLFKDIKDTKEYHNLMNHLKERKRKIQKAYSSRNDLFNESNYEIYHSEAVELIENLKSDIPRLLNMEEFFSKVFY